MPRDPHAHTLLTQWADELGAALGRPREDILPYGTVVEHMTDEQVDRGGDQ